MTILNRNIRILQFNKEADMPKNMGVIDRIVRVILVIAVAVLYFMHLITGTAAIVLGIIAVVFLATSILGFCPIYYPFGISTKKKA
jgi:hypothetical protein